MSFINLPEEIRQTIPDRPRRNRVRQENQNQTNIQLRNTLPVIPEEPESTEVLEWTSLEETQIEERHTSEQHPPRL